MPIERTESESPPLPLVYIAHQQLAFAQSIRQQLLNFAFQAEIFTTATELLAALQQQQAEALLIDINFLGAEYSGAELMCDWQAQYGHLAPLLFMATDKSMATYLQTVRANGIACLHLPAETAALVEYLQALQADNAENYRVMLVDNQAYAAANIIQALKKQPLTVQVLDDEMQILKALIEFQPDLILMNMTLSQCSGVQLARVIRLQSAFVSIPIIFMADEEDFLQQFDATVLGGDEIFHYRMPSEQFITAVLARAKRSRQLRDRMIKDSLTGLLNHSATLEALELQRLRCCREQIPLCFAMLDIDYFKKINDQHGHALGDLVLKSLAKLLTQFLRRTDIVGRYGGEEFALIMPNTELADAQKRVQALLSEFRSKIFSSGSQQLQVTFSCGVLQDQQYSVNEIKEISDKLLYQAKAAGRNRVAAAK